MSTLSKDKVVGHKITTVLGDSSRSDDSINFCDFVYCLDSGAAFRMPWAFDRTELLMEMVEIGSRHKPLSWQDPKLSLLNDKLWVPLITDVMVPEAPDARTPHTGIILLSWGWFVAQVSSAPVGIVPSVDIFPSEEISEPMVSVWSPERRFADDEDTQLD